MSVKYAPRDSHGDRYGKGSCKYTNSSRYEGEWKKCLRDGNGTDFFANGDLYVG